jgi:hypothetical protein
VPCVLAVVILLLGPALAQAIGRPEVSLWLTAIAGALFAAGLSHVIRRVWLPYVELMATIKRASEHPIGAGLVALGVLVLLSALVLATSPAKAAALPGEATRLLPVLQAEQRTHWRDMHAPHVLAAQVEQESRWRPDARLHTAREDGYGLAQFTVTPRFNVVLETIAAHPRELAGWGMSNVMDPVFQLRAMVLKDRSLWRSITGMATDDDRAAAMLAAYNGGAGSVAKRRATCRGATGCNANRWWGHAEMHPPQARVAVHGYGKSFADINTEYPRLIMRVRAAKYLPHLPPAPTLTLGAQG